MPHAHIFPQSIVEINANHECIEMCIYMPGTSNVKFISATTYDNVDTWEILKRGELPPNTAELLVFGHNEQ